MAKTKYKRKTWISIETKSITDGKTLVNVFVDKKFKEDVLDLFFLKDKTTSDLMYLSGKEVKFERPMVKKILKQNVDSVFIYLLVNGSIKAEFSNIYDLEDTISKLKKNVEAIAKIITKLGKIKIKAIIEEQW